MTKVEIVKDNPNVYAATLIISGDLLGPFSKIVIPKAGNLVNYSPLAQQIYQRNASVMRVDFASAPDKDKTLLSLSRKAIPWGEEGVQGAQNMVSEFFKSGQSAINLESLSQSIQAIKPFEPGNNPVRSLVAKAFHDQVNPILAQDGGAMELVNVDLDSTTGQIFADVVMVGSCNGCGGAKNGTLEGATKEIRSVLDVIKEKYSSNPSVQKLTFEGIRTREENELVLSRA